MMNKKLLFLFYINFLNLCTQAQVGINTSNLLGLFHVDGASSTSMTNPKTGAITALQASDDFIVKTDGKVGVGTVVPSTKLEIVGDVLIQDGTLNIKSDNSSLTTNHILVSDSEGKGSWTIFKSGIIATGEINNSIELNSTDPSQWFNITQTPLELSMGRWLVLSKILTESTCLTRNYSWLQLRSEKMGTLTTIGVIPEQPASSQHYATPQAVYIIDVVSTDKITVWAQNKSGCTKLIPPIAKYGNTSMLTAMRLK